MTERRNKTAEKLARELVNRTERLYNLRSRHKKPRAGGPLLESSAEEASHLWEHSRLVAGLARRLAEAEGLNPGPAYLAGLLHDAGKFTGGRYHEDDRLEEQSSAAEAAAILRKSGFGPRLVRRVAAALNTLYREGRKRNRLADIVHDADFLAKSGRLGVAHFFIKSTLRGRDLERMATESLSRELTYAAALPQNMRTAAGRRLARSRAVETRRYFRGLLREIEEAQGLRFTTRRLKIRILPPAAEKLSAGVRRKNAAAGAFSARAKASVRRGDLKTRSGPAALSIPVTLVHTRVCDRCGGAWRLAVSTDRGVKCKRLEARLACAACGLERGTSFCLPEIPSHRS